jgi:hypothetical protein
MGGDMKLLKLVSAAALIATALATAPFALAEVPAYVKDVCKFPANYKIGANTPTQYQKLLGVYIGTWENNGRRGVHHTLIVTDISAAGKTSFYYVIDNFPNWRLRRTCWDSKGQTTGNALSAKSPRTGAQIDYKLTDSGGTGELRTSRFVNTISLTKQPTPPEWMAGK